MRGEAFRLSSNVWGLFLTIYLVCFTRCDLTHGQRAVTKDGWAPKTMPLKRIQNAVRFKVLVPSQVPRGYKLRRSQIVWVTRSPWYPKLPPRQAVCLVYGKNGEHATFSIIEVRRLSGISVHDNLYSIICQGYFITIMKKGTILKFGTTSGTDFVIISAHLSHRQICELADSLLTSGDKAKRKSKTGRMWDKK